MRSLVTGAAGFIGSALVKRIKDNGKQVVECDVTSADMITPKEVIENFEKLQIDKIYHLGAISSTTESDIEKIVNNNILLTARFCQLAIEREIPFTYASSASVYGHGLDGFREDSYCNPLNYYAISKYAADLMVMQKIKDNRNCNLVGLRYYNVYGPFEKGKGSMASPVYQFFKQANSFGKINIFDGSEKYSRDFIHVDDVVSLTMESCSYPSGIYNIGTGQSRSFLEVAEKISKITGASIERIQFPEKLLGKYQKFTCSDNTKIRTVSNLRSRITLEDGISKVYSGE